MHGEAAHPVQPSGQSSSIAQPPLQIGDARLDCRELTPRPRKQLRLHVELLAGHEFEPAEGPGDECPEILFDVAPRAGGQDFRHPSGHFFEPFRLLHIYHTEKFKKSARH